MGLENRYRRLLRCFPSEYPREHEEEIIGVLMAGAPPDRTRPDPRDTLDLLRGALLIHLRRLTAGRWQDAFAIVSVIAPALLLALSLCSVVRSAFLTLTWVNASPAPGTPTGQEWHVAVLLASTWLPWAAWGAVAVLALTGARRVAAGAAFALAAVPVAAALLGVHHFGWGSASSDLPVLLALLTGVAVRVSPGRPARAAAAPSRQAVVAVVALVLAVVALDPLVLVMPVLAPGVPIAVLVFGVLLRDATGRRAFALLAMPGMCPLYAYVPVGVHGTAVRVAVFVVVVPLVAFALTETGIRMLERAPR